MSLFVNGIKNSRGDRSESYPSTCPSDYTIQYACQRHYFLAMAEKYFDDQLRDVSVNAHRQQKTIDAFERLPEEFTVDDAKRCFSLTNDTVARVKISRLMKDHFVEKAGDFVENGTTKAVFKKTGKVMR